MTSRSTWGRRIRFVRGEGIVINEPSVVAIHEADQSIIAVGREAKAMLGRTPGNIRVIRPLKEGAIADFDVTEQMLSYFIAQGHRWRRTILRPRVVVGVFSGITQVEQRAVRDAALHAGARAVYLVEDPVAAAMGAGLPIHEPGGNLIVDIGGGTTEVAVLSLAGVIYCKSVRIAGDQMDEAIQQPTLPPIFGDRSTRVLHLQPAARGSGFVQPGLAA